MVWVAVVGGLEGNRDVEARHGVENRSRDLRTGEHLAVLCSTVGKAALQNPVVLDQDLAGSDDVSDTATAP